MIRRPPRATRTDTLFPYTTLFRSIMRKKTAWLALLLAAFAMTASAQVDVEPYVRKDAFQTIEISPDGRYLAATVPKEDRTGVVILQRGDLKVTASFALGKNSHVNRVWWVNPERLVISISEKFGMLAKQIGRAHV